MTGFRYHSDIIERFPDVAGGVILARGMQNRPTPDELLTLYETEQKVVIERIGDTPLSELDNLAAWRSAFREFGVNPTRYRSAVEALLRRLTKKGDIPTINAVVDICNLISIRYQLPVAAFDTRALTGPITVQFADGNERFIPLFEEEFEHPDAGEVIFADEDDLVVARRWCWRQSDESATREGTVEAVFTIESQHTGGASQVQEAVDDLAELLSQYVGGELVSGLVTRDDPAFSR